MSPTPHPAIFAFESLRDYLRAWFDWWKVQNRRNSHRHLAVLLGSNDPSLIVNVVEGRRALPRRRVEAMLTTVLADLEPLEARYFRALAEVERAREEDRAEALERVQVLRSENSAHVLARERVEILGRWWYYAVASLAEGRHGVSLDDPAAVSTALYGRISPEVAAQAVHQLTNAGVLVPAEGGGFRVEQPTFTTAAEVARHATRQYHSDALQLAESALATLASTDKPEQRRARFLGVTFSLSEEALATVQEELFDFQQRVLALAARDASASGPHRVFQLNLHLFPLSRVSAGSDTNHE